MTASTVKSTNITNIEANPMVTIDERIGNLRVVMDHIAVATTSVDEIDDIILLGPIPSNSTLVDIEVMNDVLDSDGVLAFDVGLYYSGKGSQSSTAQASGVEIDDNCIATAATTLGAANTAWATLRYEAANITSLAQQAYELGGLSVDPGGLFYIGLKVTTAATTAVAGDVVVKISYIN